ncbi:MAG: hypothetical protein FJ319_10380 [SAR202 cluster bacterium]|nr:hypothetical protein [SAR202 cluster bacterium]
MSDFGLAVKGETGSKRIELECEHQNALIYVVPSETSWVCKPELLHVHALAGFFKQLAKLNDPDVKEIMQRWGVYYRERPLASEKPDAPHGGAPQVSDLPVQKNTTSV